MKSFPCSLLLVVLCTLLLGAAPALAAALLPPPAPSDQLFLVPARGELLHNLGSLQLVHRYGESLLVVLPAAATLPAAVQSQLHPVAVNDRIVFRSWSAALALPDLATVKALAKAYYALALVAPADPAWPQALQDLGLQIVARAYPATLVVKADGAMLARALQLTTSAGLAVVRGLLPLPAAARLSRDLQTELKSARPEQAIPVTVTTFDRRSLRSLLQRTTVLPAGSKVVGDRVTLSLRATEIELLARQPELAYLERHHDKELHNNLAARSHLIDAESVWNELGYNGAGVIVNHNDTGVDLDHPDLPLEAFAAVNGAMSRTDNGHGTHTAGSIIGRGGAPSPINSSGCGDRVAPLAEVRGIAWGARLATNNMFSGGLDEVDRMLWWAAQKGAVISSNSWGFKGELEAVTAYGAASVAVDAAVRDADATSPGHQAMAVFFSAGNLGPDPGTVTGPGNAKNAVTVGASHNDRCGSYLPANEDGPDPRRVLAASSRGPAQARLKPDLVAPGSDLLSVQSRDEQAVLPWDQEWTGERYGLEPGTSMACALAAGAAAVFHELYWSTFAAQPSPALVKAALINGAVDLGYGYPSTVQGWGRLDLRRSISGPANGSITFFDQQLTAGLHTGDRWRHELEVFSAVEPLEITLVWTDPPGEEDASHPLQNDLDLVVTAADGTIYRGNQLVESWSAPDPGLVSDTDNPVEVVLVELPAAGTWTVEVVAANAAVTVAGLDGQDFALVYSGDAGDCVAPPPPTGLTASAGGDNQIDLSWAAVAGASRYQVLRALQAGGRPYLPLATVTAPAVSFSDTTVSGGISYFYVVRVELNDDNCWSAPTAEVTAVTSGSCHLPPVFAGLDAVSDAAQVSCALDLGWQPATLPCSGEATYTVSRSTDPDPATMTIVASGVSGTGFRDTGLVNGLRYFYLVQASDPGNGTSEHNQLLRSAVPTGPDSVYLAHDVEQGEQGWFSAPGSAADLAGGPWQVVENRVHSPTHAWHCADADQIKDQALVMPAPLVVPVGVPLVLELWQRYELEERYDGGRLEYSVDGGQVWQDILAGNGYSVAADPARLLEGGYTAVLSSRSSSPIGGQAAWTGTSLGWTMVRVDLSGFAGQPLLLRWRLACDERERVDGGWWLDDLRFVVTSSCQTCAAPPSPAQLTATAASGGVALSWAATPGASSYRVLRADTITGPFQVLAELAGTSYLDKTASGGSSYAYTARLLAAGCWSEQAQPVVVTATGPCTLAPAFYGLSSVTTKHAAACWLDLAWPAATARCDGGVHYRLYRSRQPGLEPGPATLFADQLTGTGYRDEAVVGGEHYHYLVQAVDDSSGLGDGNQKVLSATVGGPILTVLEDDIELDTGLWLTATGSAADSGSEPWTVVSEASHSGTQAWFCSNQGQVKDQTLGLAEPIRIPDWPTTVLELWHRFNLESLWDGGRLEYSVDGGQTWLDILAGDGGAIPANPDRFLAGGYTGRLLSQPATNPLAGALAWTGANGGWTMVRVSLADLRGRDLLLRWRLGCDVTRAAVGWWLDDLRITYEIPCTTTPRPVSGRRY